jgi:hypothetical protein
MGVALYVVLEREVAGFDASSVCGKFLAKAQSRLDGIARRHGLTPLTDLISTNPEEATALLGGEGGVPEGVELPAEQWFDPAEGPRAVRGLLDHIRAEPSAVPNSRRVVADLEATEQVLAAAAVQGIRFHLAVDF